MNNTTGTPLGSETLAEGAHTVRQRAGDLARRANDRVGDITTGAGKGLSAAAEGIRGGADAVARRLDTAGDYLRDTDAKGIGSDIAGVIRRHPKTSIIIGLGLGFLVARMLLR